jgi:hypothetical protein
MVWDPPHAHGSITNPRCSSVDLVIKVVRPILEKRAASIEVRRDAEKDWCDTIQGALRRTILTRSCQNVSELVYEAF